MGFNKKYLPELKELKEEYKTSGHEEFVRIYRKYDAFIGPAPSINFVQKKLIKKTN